jgi:hypothetical protein
MLILFTISCSKEEQEQATECWQCDTYTKVTIMGVTHYDILEKSERVCDAKTVSGLDGKTWFISTSYSPAQTVKKEGYIKCKKF